MTARDHDFTDELKSLPAKPGVYKMLDQHGEVIYVGKAANLRKRVGSYFNKRHHDVKTDVLISHIHTIDTIVTHTESEALLLEHNLIKELRPRYNILYRDDKSYPYIYVSLQDKYPRLAFHRGAQHGTGRYFGPYPNAGAVRVTLQLLQKLFPVRQCEDVFFTNRTRPCLQYQIHRCTAPCVELISPQAYAEDVRHAVMFLEGRNNDVINELVKRMERAAEALDYEKAARIRDQIGRLQRVQEKQYITHGGGDCDIIAAATDKGVGCVQIFMIRGGRNLGNKTFFPQALLGDNTVSLLEAFLPQYYLRETQTGYDIPARILLSDPVADKTMLQALFSQLCQHKVFISHLGRGEQAKWLRMARQNAELSLRSRLTSRSTLLQRFEALRAVFQLVDVPSHVECFDISHSAGEATVASCVVFGAEGAMTSAYRRFNISGITPGDDYAAMEQVLLRRYKKIEAGEGIIPDLILIDGGKGQVHRAQQALAELQLANILIIGVAKGPERRAGQERLYVVDCLSDAGREIILPPDSMALHLIQQIRDEAHRFAVSGHRQRRQTARRRSALEDIPGLGPKRRQRLLRHFGGLQEVIRAGVDDLSRVPGIHAALAQRIYATFHDE